MDRRAIVIFPPPTDMARVEAVRQQFDSLAGSIRAHLTLVFPFESNLSESDLKRHVEETTVGIESFPITLSGLSCTEDHVLFLHVARGSGDIETLHDRLYSGPLERYQSHQTFVPHMSIGRFKSSAACTTALESPRLADLKLRTVAKAVSVYKIPADGDRRIESVVVLRRSGYQSRINR